MKKNYDMIWFIPTLIVVIAMIFIACNDISEKEEAEKLEIDYLVNFEHDGHLFMKWGNRADILLHHPDCKKCADKALKIEIPSVVRIKKEPDEFIYFGSGGVIIDSGGIIKVDSTEQKE